jgi:hypothetical protein
MKTTNQFFAVIALLLLLNTSYGFSQDTPQRPQYVTVTTMHWNMDNTDDDWEAVEKEYLDKVTMKNEHVIMAGFFVHRWTADNTELKYMQVFKDWDAIDKAGERNAELEKLAWPDEKTREAFLKKQGAFYSVHHSDEIYATMDNAKLMGEKPTKDMIFYYQTTHFAFPEDGTNIEFGALHKEYVDNVIKKNISIKGYYPHRHAWGADRTEFKQAYLLDSMDDLEKLNETNGALFNAHWKDEASRKAFGEKMSKYYTSVHSDEIYTAIAALSK